VVQMDDKITEVHERAILQQTPNGVLLVDKQTLIRFANPAFRTMFQCHDEQVLGQRVGSFMHSDCFDRVIAVNKPITVKENCKEHGVSFRAGLFPIEGENLYCGIFIDISDAEREREQYRRLRAQTLERAQEVITRQMKTAQEIARLLGETTAETKVILVQLMSLFKEETTK